MIVSPLCAMSFALRTCSASHHERALLFINQKVHRFGEPGVKGLSLNIARYALSFGPETQRNAETAPAVTIARSYPTEPTQSEKGRICVTPAQDRWAKPC